MTLNSARRSARRCSPWLSSWLPRPQSPCQRGGLLFNGGARGAQPGDRPLPIGSHTHPGIASGPNGRADQLGMERAGGVAAGACCAIVDPVGPALDTAWFPLAGLKASPDQAGRAAAQTRLRASQDRRQAGGLRGMAAMVIRGGWLRFLGRLRRRRMEPLLALVPPRLPERRPRGVGSARLRLQRQLRGLGWL
jgi:hypothetical protein